jgi:hypothetical protein
VIYLAEKEAFSDLGGWGSDERADPPRTAKWFPETFLFCEALCEACMPFVYSPTLSRCGPFKRLACSLSPCLIDVSFWKSNISLFSCSL